MIDAILMAAIRKDIDFWERPIFWMYLDSEGYVTLGSGIMLPDAASAKAIKFYHSKSLLPASPSEIEAAWKTLHSGAKTQKAAAQKNKFSAAHYKNVTDLLITKHTSEKLRDAHINADYLVLKQIYGNFDKFPDNAKIALFDMIYNLGAGKKKTHHHHATGLRQYILMNTAINKGDWKKAASQCGRRGIPTARNRMVEKLFKSCEKQIKYNSLEIMYA